MICVKDKETECPLDLDDVVRQQAATLAALNIIAGKLPAMFTGNNDCDECNSLKLEFAMEIYDSLLQGGFAIVMVKTPVAVLVR